MGPLLPFIEEWNHIRVVRRLRLTQFKELEGSEGRGLRKRRQGEISGEERTEDPVSPAPVPGEQESSPLKLTSSNSFSFSNL